MLSGMHGAAVRGSVILLLVAGCPSSPPGIHQDSDHGTTGGQGTSSNSSSTHAVTSLDGGPTTGEGTGEGTGSPTEDASTSQPVAASGSGSGDSDGSSTTSGSTEDGSPEGSEAASSESSTAGDVAVRITSPAWLRLERGQSGSVPITLEHEGEPSAVTVRAVDLPEGVTAEAILIAADAAMGTIVVEADVGASVGSSMITLEAEAEGASGFDTAVLELIVADPPGTADTSFDLDGVVWLTEEGTDAAVEHLVAQREGGIVVGIGGGTAAWRIVRLTEEGTVDAGFVPEAPPSGELEALAQDSQGRIIAVGQGGADGDAVVRRYHANGAPDAGFAGSGSFMLPRGSFSMMNHAIAVAVAPDDSLFVLIAHDGGTVYQEYIHIHEDGTFDEALGRVDSVGGVGQFFGLVVTPGGALLLGGTHTGEDPDLRLVQYTAEGQLDGSYGDEGTRTIDIAIDAYRVGPMLLSDGRAVIAGFDVGGIGEPVLGVATPGGLLDESFAMGGSLIEGDLSPNGAFSAMASLPGGGLVVVGSWGTGASRYRGFVRRYDDRGAPTGSSDYANDALDFRLNAVATTPDGRVIAGGHQSDRGPWMLRQW